MLEFFNMFLNCVSHLFVVYSAIELDGYTFSYMIIGTMIIGAVVTATIGAVGIIATKAQRGGR